MPEQGGGSQNAEEWVTASRGLETDERIAISFE
jgi:hypothetical protein